MYQQDKRGKDYWERQFGRKTVVIPESGRPQNQNEHAAFWRKFWRSFGVLTALYLIYVVYHFGMGAYYGCNAQMSFLFLFPVKQIYTIPLVDNAISGSFSEDFNPNNLSPAAMKMTAGLGTLLGALAKDHLSIEQCPMWNSFGVLGGNVGPSSRAEVEFAESTEKRPCVLDAELNSLLCPDAPADYYVGPTATPFWKAAELVPLSAFMYNDPKASASVIAICERSRMGVVVYNRMNAFYKARCNGRRGWVEAKHIRILD